MRELIKREDLAAEWVRAQIVSAERAHGPVEGLMVTITYDAPDEPGVKDEAFLDVWERHAALTRMATDT